MAKLLDQGPVLVLTFQAQQLTVTKSGEEEPDNVSARLPAGLSFTCSPTLASFPGPTPKNWLGEDWE